PNGAIMNKWTPTIEGAGFDLPAILEPLKPFRDQLLVLSGLDNKPAQALVGVDVTGEHPRASSAFLTGTHVYYRSHDLTAGISVDQVMAREFKNQTQLGS